MLYSGCFSSSVTFCGFCACYTVQGGVCHVLAAEFHFKIVVDVSFNNTHMHKSNT